MSAIIVFTTGEPGAGKSYVRGVRFLLDDFLVNTDGVHFSNIPLVREELVKEAVRRLNFAKKGPFATLTAPFRRRSRMVTPEDVEKRIHVIPEDVMNAWRSGVSGPWEYFDGQDLRYAHIAIDEIHECIPFNASPERVLLWENFLGTIRHRGCTFECITQTPERVHDCVKGRAGIQIQLCPAESERDPFFHIVMSDWYNLKASFTGEYHKTVFERHLKQVFGKWRATITKRFLILPEYYRFWHSYSSSTGEADNGVKAEDRAPKQEYQLRSRLSLLAWFIRRNFFSLFSRLVIGGVVFWLCFCGGMVTLIHGFLGMTNLMAKSNGVTASSPAVPGGSSAPSPSVSKRAGGLSASSNPDSSSAHDNMVSYKEYAALNAEADNLRSRLTDATIEIATLKEERNKRFEPVFFGREDVSLVNGQRIYNGYTFEKGTPYEGRKVKFVDTRNRSYELDDGTIIRMWSR